MATKSLNVVGRGGVGPMSLMASKSTTGRGDDYILPLPLSAFGLQVVTGGSTSTVKANVKLLGSLDTSSTISSAKLFGLSTWTSTGGTQSNGDIVFTTGIPVSRIVARLDVISSTSSTGPNVTVRAVAAQP